MTEVYFPCRDCGVELWKPGEAGQITKRCKSCTGNQDKALQKGWRKEKSIRAGKTPGMFRCIDCNSLLETNSPHQQICQDCRGIRDAPMAFACVKCGGQYYRTAPHQNQCLDCGTRKKQHPTPVCKECGIEMPNRHHSAKICGDCSDKRHREGAKERYLENREGIIARVRRYAQENADKLREQRRAYRKTEKGRATANVSKRRRRAQKRGLPSIPYKDKDIFERDAWRCKLCGMPVEVDPSDWIYGPSIDHIVALNNGGPNTPQNVQLAHRGCNSNKSDRESPDKKYVEEMQSKVLTRILCERTAPALC